MYIRLILSAGLFLTLVPTVLADGPQMGNNGVADDIGGVPGVLGPRISVIQKMPHVTRPMGVSSQLMVKFRDRARMRPDGNGGIAALGGAPLLGVAQVQQRFDITFTSAFEQTQVELTAVENKVKRLSGRQQPDLGGIMIVEGPDAQLEEIANALNALDIVEFATFLEKVILYGSVGTPNPGQLAATLATSALASGPPIIPNFEPNQGYRRFFNDLNGNGVFDVPFGMNFWDAPEFSGGIHVADAQQFGRDIIDLGLVDPSWNVNRNGGRGDTIRVGVVEFGAFIEDRFDGVHFDLEHVIVEPGQVILPAAFMGVSDKNHGTATLGEIGAFDHGEPGPEDESGTLGMVPGAQIWFFPTVSASQPGGRLQSAMLSALQTFDRGDVLNYSIGFGSGPLPTNPTIAIILRMMADAGITSVMSAGNDCANLDDNQFWPAFDHGGVIVGAGFPVIGVRPDLAPFTRLSFSNHDTESGRVHVQAWGAGVFTTGFGDAFDIDGDPRFAYTAGFSGTSSAAPIIAATAASLQGLAKMRFGIPLLPEQIRSVLQSGFLQEGVPPDCVSGLDEDAPCAELFYVQNCPPDDPDPDLIGVLPEWAIMFESLNTGSWFDPSILVDVIVYAGNHILGNVNSLKSADNSALIVRSKFAGDAFGRGRDPFPAPVFMFPGKLTDIGAMAVIPNPRAGTAGNVTYRLATNAAGFPLGGFEAYNWQTNQWDFLGVDVDLDITYHDIRELPNPTFPITAAHVNQNNGRVIVRGWVLELGLGNGSFDVAYDLIDLTTFGFGGGAGGIGDP